MVSHSSYLGLSLFLAFAFSLLSVSESEQEATSEPNLTQTVRLARILTFTTDSKKSERALKISIMTELSTAGAYNPDTGEFAGYIRLRLGTSTYHSECSC